MSNHSGVPSEIDDERDDGECVIEDDLPWVRAARNDMDQGCWFPKAADAAKEPT